MLDLEKGKYQTRIKQKHKSRMEYAELKGNGHQHLHSIVGAGA